MKRADAEVSDDKHLLPQGGEAETKNTALVVSDDTDDGKGEHDGGQCVEKTADGVPQKILFLIIFFIHTSLFVTSFTSAGPASFSGCAMPASCRAPCTSRIDTSMRAM